MGNQDHISHSSQVDPFNCNSSRLHSVGRSVGLSVNQPTSSVNHSTKHESIYLSKLGTRNVIGKLFDREADS